MRTSKLFPLLSGLVLSLASACGDDGSSDTDTTDTTDTGADASDDSTASDSDESSTDETNTSQSTTHSTDSESDDTSTDTANDEDAGASDDGDAADDSAEGDGGSSSDGGDETTDDDAGSSDDGDGGQSGEGDGGTADAEVDAAPLPDGACALSPINPDNGSYAICDGTLNGGTCQLDCTQGNFVGGLAICNDGVWTESACVRLGSLTAEIGNAATGADLANAEVYVEGFYDPTTDDCEANPYCAITGNNGVVEFEDFPSGPQKVVVVKTGFDQIALPVNVGPGEDPSIHLDALPTGFLAGNIVVLLGWEATGTDLDLLLSIPAAELDVDAGNDAGAGQCVFRADAFRGSLSADPFARLEHDAEPPSSPRGPETIRIALNDAETGPYYDGIYSLIVMGHTGANLNDAHPTVRVIRASDNGGADVELFTLPEDAIDSATEWHVLDLDGSSVIPAGATESNPENASATELPCVAKAFEAP